MKNTGMVRKVDRLGRVVVPMELRKAYGYVVGQSLEISVDGQNIVVTKASAQPGLVRGIDDLGRLTIPAEIRKTKEIAIGDSLTFYVDGESFILRKYSGSLGCLSCKGYTGEKSVTIPNTGQQICFDCIDELCKTRDLALTLIK